MNRGRKNNFFCEYYACWLSYEDCYARKTALVYADETLVTKNYETRNNDGNVERKHPYCALTCEFVPPVKSLPEKKRYCECGCGRELPAFTRYRYHALCIPHILDKIRAIKKEEDEKEKEEKERWKRQ